MQTKIISWGGDAHETYDACQIVDDNEAVITHASMRTLDTWYNGNLIKTLAIGGVSTPPEYRRNGYSRRVMNEIFRIAPERGWVVSILHPFSFSYYRMYGFEKLSNHVILEFPMKALDCFPRYPDLVPLKDESLFPDFLKVYNNFVKIRNLMLSRYATDKYPCQPTAERYAYIYYNKAGEPEAYVILGREQYYYVNHLVSVNLHVYELVYNTPESLYAVLGFLRMYEGELDTVKIHDCAMAPEIDMLLRHYTHTKYTVIPDLMGRILDIKGIMSAHRYPDEEGHFSFYVEDSLDFTRGNWAVEYGKGKAEAYRLPDDSKVDFEVPMPAFTAMVYGYDEYTPENSAYLPGMKLNNHDSSFFKVFRKESCGSFEHF